MVDDFISTLTIRAFHSPSMGSTKVEAPFLALSNDLSDKLFPNRALPQEEDSEFPRLIDVRSFLKWRRSLIKPGDIRAPDMIFTVLYNYDHDQKVLKAFLDPNQENVAFYRCAEDNFDIFIKKQGKFLSESHI